MRAANVQTKRARQMCWRKATTSALANRDDACDGQPRCNVHGCRVTDMLADSDAMRIAQQEICQMCMSTMLPDAYETTRTICAGPRGRHVETNIKYHGLTAVGESNLGGPPLINSNNDRLQANVAVANGMCV